MRPRGLHLDERHITIDGRRAVGALVDFGLYFFHNAAVLRENGSGPYFYLPKLESHLEARLWNDVFSAAEETLGIPHGTVRATALIGTVPAAFEMSEILYELRKHASGLDADWPDYLFSVLKHFRDAGPGFVLPDRHAMTASAPFLRAFADLLVHTCHAHGAFAIGGTAVVVPACRDTAAGRRALTGVQQDKLLEAAAGFDGSWVAHPDLVPVCRAVFDRVLGARPNQLDRHRTDVHVAAAQLLDLTGAGGTRSVAGLRADVTLGVRYLASWLAGTGATAIDDERVDTAIAEIARTQVWQWLHNGVTLDTGEPVTADLVRALIAEAPLGDDDPETARRLYERVALADDFVEFLTIPAYELID